MAMQQLNQKRSKSRYAYPYNLYLRYLNRVILSQEYLSSLQTRVIAMKLLDQ